MKKSIFVSLCLLAAAFAASPGFLARVDLSGNQSIQDIDAMGMGVLVELDRYCLVHVSDEELLRLADRFQVEVLDREPEGKLYVYAMPRSGLDPSRLSEYGTVLAEDEMGVIIRTTEQGVYEMNALPVELARIGLDPMVITRDVPGLPSLPAVDDSLIWALVNSITEDSVKARIQRLQDFYTRYSTHDSCLVAMEWVRSKFEAYGCDTTFLFPFQYNYAPNAVGIRYGTVNPQRIYGICGHTDATSNHRPDHCPGSDDNASGTTAVLEACRVFQEVEFEHTVYFLAFSGEEQGLHGSDSFAEFAFRRGDSIKAMLNFDMISYGRENIDTFKIIGKWSNPVCEWLVDFYIAQADTFTTLKTRKYMTNSAPYSDHHSFWLRGYPAFCGIENDFTPCYHTIGDTIGPQYYRRCGTNNAPMATQAIKAAVAAIAKFAGAYVPTAVEESHQDARPARLLGINPTVGPAPLSLRMSRPLSSDVTLEVFDAIGRQVRALDAGGKVDIAWDGKDDFGRKVGPGIYLFRLTDRATSTTAKAILTD